MCFHVCRKCLTPGPLLTSNLGCQRHFLECPVKINMWTETRGLRTPAWWTGEPSWHLCPATPFASYPNVRLYKIKGLFYLFLSWKPSKWEHYSLCTLQEHESWKSKKCLLKFVPISRFVCALLSCFGFVFHYVQKKPHHLVCFSRW